MALDALNAKKVFGFLNITFGVDSSCIRISVDSAYDG